MKDLNTSIVFIGMTCSGKSTLANELSKVITHKKASFGGYLFDYAQKNNLDARKGSLQILGQGFIETDYKLFLTDVLNFSKPGNEVIFEGVRHLIIYKEIEHLSLNTISFFIDTPFDLRFKRYNLREAEQLTEDQFLALDNHPVEREIEALRQSCNITLDGRKDISTLLSEILTYTQLPKFSA